MVNQFPLPAFLTKDVGRTLAEFDHRTVRRPHLSGLGANRVADIAVGDDANVLRFDMAAGIRADHVLNMGVNLVPSELLAAVGAQVGDVGTMRPYGAQRFEITLDGAVESGVEERRRGADLFLGR